jgi:type II secretory ATPase GspE/PulE/Tfp pilus assembly ATPase PilB-like protein
VRTAFHHDLLAALVEAPRGLIVVTGPTGHGKTTAIEEVIADPMCPSNVAFVGDIRGDVEPALRAVELARSRRVLAVLRIPRAAGAFTRMSDVGVPSSDFADVVHMIFTTRLFRITAAKPLLIHERLVVTDAVRALVLAGADAEAVHRQAMAEGMRSLRQTGLEEVEAGRLPEGAVVEMTPDD